jgi:predicted nucleic acid-binding protein
MKSNRAHILLPHDLVKEIDSIVGPRGRSAFLVETALEAVRRRKLLRFLEIDTPAGKMRIIPRSLAALDSGCMSSARRAITSASESGSGRKMKLLLDTSILIDVLRHRKRRNAWLAELVRGGNTLATTTLNIAEIYAGMRPAEEGETEALLSGLEVYELTGTSARLAGRLKNTWAKRGHTLTLADTIVAAIAIDRGCALLTDNRKDLPMPEVQLYPVP